MGRKRSFKTQLTELIDARVKVALARLLGEVISETQQPEATGIETPKARPGRPRKLSDAERKRRAREYQRGYRARKREELQRQLEPRR